MTASFAADRATAAADGIAAIRAGFRLAVPVALRKGDPLPSHLTLAAGGEAVTVPAIDADVSDHRWADDHRVACILRTKRSRGAGPEADAFSLAAHGLPQYLADGHVLLSWEG